MGVFLENLKIQYIIGKSCVSKDYNFANNMNVLNKQFLLSIPLITGVRIKYKKNKKKYLQKIYVGKELYLKDIIREEYLLNKYNLEVSDVADIAVMGYKRACLLNFKKYDQVMVGVDDNSIIVPDYYALKKLLFQIQRQATT